MRTTKALSIAVLLLTLSAANSHAAGRSHWLEHLPAPVSDGDYFDNGSPPADKVRLGQFLYWDKILSGNENISCATCHHSLTGTGDGLALPVGEGGNGLGITRDTGTDADVIHERVPRNAPPVYNLGALDFEVMFHDGRLAADPDAPSGFRSPAGDAFPAGLDNALAAQAMFPVTSGAEMAGQAGENAVADAAASNDLAGPSGVWAQLAARLRAIPEYVELFTRAYPDIVSATDITFVHAANAIGAYEAVAFRADDSPFDRYLRGRQGAMSDQAKAGMRLFYGKARCSRCHNGPFQTDLGFHAIGVPQVGPGKGNGYDGHDDYGRFNETGDPVDMYRFRTPSLRNVALTGPWGHDGAYDSLRAVVEHHLDPIASLAAYDPSQLALPSRDDLDEIDLMVHEDPASRAALAAACELKPVALRRSEVDSLIAFLHALTDPDSLDARMTVPRYVPSGLPLFD